LLPAARGATQEKPMLARGVSAFRLALALGMFTEPALAGSPSDPASAAATVRVILGDPSSIPPLPTMTLIAKPNPVVGGRVTFTVTNTSRTLQHELLVVRVPGGQERLPYSEISRRVVESRIDKIGDSGDLPASRSATFTVRLKPGKYLLICNQPGHYQAGMWDWLTVTRDTLRTRGVGR
jgi:uncharacterized cupredoxin-like copper-binding protein